MSDQRHTKHFTLRVRGRAVIEWTKALHCVRFGWMLTNVNWTRDGVKFIINLTFKRRVMFCFRRIRLYPKLPLSLLTKSLRKKLLGHR